MSGKSRQKSRAELKVENKLLRQFNIIGEIASIINNAIRWGGVVAIVYLASSSISVLAGKTTFADIGINFLADIRVSEALAWILGSSGVAYGWLQRSLRKKTVERLQQRVVNLESEKDGRRTSSQLTPRGGTKPEDKQ